VKVRFVLNGAPAEIDGAADQMVLTVLRERFDLLSVRPTCGIGVCGTCTALVDGEPISTCILLAPLIDGREVTTVEGLGGNDPVQRAFEQHHAAQCGYCTPGMILTAKRFLEETPRPTRQQVVDALGGNLCRCGSYVKIVDAIEGAAR
jgi:aerobic-type carbon monoxide dehydrogenase small subunit (CoxS/CutS family)